jgi:predicted metal-binding membrane protein
MRGKAMGLGQIGGRAQGDMSAGVFLVMWVTMMVAMMLPTAVPIVLAHLAVTRGRAVAFI